MSNSDLGRFAGTAAHLVAVTVGLGAGAIIVMMGVTRLEDPVAPYGERLLSHSLTTLAVSPGLLVLAGLTIWPYRRIASRYSRRGLVLFHALEVMVATLLAAIAFRLVGDGWGYLL